MKRILTTTALLTLLAAEASAQNSAIAVPEGYSAYGDTAMLSFEQLQGVTVYDARGEALSDIVDIIFAVDDSQTTPDTASGAVTGDAMPQTQAETDAQTDVQPDGADDTLLSDAEPSTENDTRVDGADMAAGDAMTDPAETQDQTPDAMANGGTVDQGVADGLAEGETTGDITTETTGDTTTGDTGLNDAMAAEETAIDQMTSGQSRISHVVIDVGGFLGMGVHTVAVPVEALEVFVDTGNTLQVFLPWTEDQLRDLPAYEEGNPATLGQMTTTGG